MIEPQSSWHEGVAEQYECVGDITGNIYLM